jgi:hypothetical protein
LLKAKFPEGLTCITGDHGRREHDIQGPVLPKIVHEFMRTIIEDGMIERINMQLGILKRQQEDAVETE